MARIKSKRELRKLLQSYMHNPESVDFSRLSLESKKELFALLYQDCYDMVSNGKKGINNLLDKFFAAFVADQKSKLRSDAKVQQLFKEITDANEYGVEFPVESDERAGLDLLQKEFNGFRITTSDGTTRKTGPKKVIEDVDLMDEASLDSGFKTLLDTYEKAHRMYSRFSNINTICIDEPVKAKDALDKYNGIGEKLAGIDMAEIKQLLKQHKYSVVHKKINDAINEYNNKKNPSNDSSGLTPPAGNKKKKGFLRRVGEAILRRPVIAGTVAFAVALPIAGAVSLTTLPSFFLWGAVGLAAGGNGLKAIAKAVVPGYERFIYDYDVERIGSKLEVNRAKQQRVLDIVNTKLKKNPKVTLDDARAYVAPSMGDGIVQWFKGMKGSINARNAQKTKERILDSVGKVDISSVDKAHIKEIAKLARQEERLVRKGNRKYNKLINKADIADVDAYKADSERRDKMIKGTIAEEDSKTVAEIRSQARKKKATVEGYKKAVTNTKSAAREIVEEYLSHGKVREALEYVVDDMKANEGKQNPELLDLVQTKIGKVGRLYVNARAMEEVIGSKKYSASENVLKYLGADDTQRSSMKDELQKSMSSTVGAYYFKTKKSQTALRDYMMSQYGDEELKKVANQAFKDAKKEATTPPEERYVGDDFFK